MAVQVKQININEEIKTLARRINQNLCILFIGPGALLIKDGTPLDGTPLNEAFSLSLAKELVNENIPFDTDGERNIAYMVQAYIQGKNEKLGRKAYKIVDLRDRYNAFFKEARLDYSVYEMLSNIPFSLVINTNYDYYFTDLFKLKHESRDRKVQFSMYDFSNKKISPNATVSAISSPDRNNLVIYNLFGLCNDDFLNSIILTETEFVRFVGRIHQINTALPVEITNYIDQNKYCLFLGFDFNQWYLKVVIRALWNGCQADIDNQNLPDSLALGLPPYPTAFFYEDAFKFYFVNDDLKSFVSSLESKISGKDVGEKNINDTPAKPSNPVNIFFISDFESADDNLYRDEISKFLRYLVDNKYAAMWTEDMAIGESFDRKRSEKLQDADIIIALVSADFILSDKHYVITQYRSLFKPHVKKLAVLLRPYSYNKINELKDFTWVPIKGDQDSGIKAVSLFSPNEQENTINEIVNYITENVYDLIK